MFGFGKAKEEPWTGIVVKKGQGANVDEDGKRTIYHVLVVKRDDTGKTKNYVVGSAWVTPQLFNALHEGDKVAKPSGTKAIEKA